MMSIISRKTVALVIALIFLLALSFSLTNQAKANSIEIRKRIKIAVSISALKEIIEEAIGPSAEVEVLLPEGAEPHLFQVTSSIVERASSSDLIVHTGHFNFEYKIVEAVKKPSIGLEEFRKRGLILLRYPGSEEENPHGYWLYPHNSLVIAEAVVDKLISMDPIHAEVYMESLELFKERLKKLEREFSRAKSHYGLEKLKVIASSPAEQYLVEALGMSVIAFISKGHSVLMSGREMQTIEERLRKGEYDFIVISDVSEASKIGDFARELSLDTGVPTLKFSVVSTEGFPSYSSHMFYNLGCVISALKSKSEVKSSKSIFPSRLILSILTSLTIIAFIEGVLLIKVWKKVS